MFTIHRRQVTRTLVCAALAVVPFVTAASDTRAGDLAYVDCDWNPYREAWACALPTAFAEGRFNAPPSYRHDEASVQARQRTYAEAKTEPGARARGRLGVFVPSTAGTWSFVPGSSWSPGDPVFFPRAKPIPPPVVKPQLGAPVATPPSGTPDVKPTLGTPVAQLPLR
jgi:hypothetical protein